MQNLEPQDFQNQVLNRLDRIDSRLSTLEDKVDNLEDKVDNLEGKVDKLEVDIRETVQRVDKWEERFLQLSRDNLSISRTVIIAAAAATIFTPLVQSLAPAIAALLRAQ
jgi:predicted nuclease with TOPRIM domain